MKTIPCLENSTPEFEVDLDRLEAVCAAMLKMARDVGIERPVLAFDGEWSLLYRSNDVSPFCSGTLEQIYWRLRERGYELIMAGKNYDRPMVRHNPPDRLGWVVRSKWTMPQWFETESEMAAWIEALPERS